MDMSKTALLLIDLQKEGGTSDVVGMEAILANAASLVDKCRQLGIPVIYTRHINRGDGLGLANEEPVNEAGEPIYYHSKTSTIEIAEEVAPAPQDIIIDKYRYSGFFESNLELILKSLGVKHLIIGGVLTDVCVLSTALDAYYRDYQINLVKDMCGTTTEGAHMASVLMMANWIYDLKIYDAAEMEKKLVDKKQVDKKHDAWESTAPDQLQFSPDNLRSIYEKLSGIENTNDS